MSTFTIRAVGTIGALALAAPATALAQQPTLQFDRGCYTEDQAMAFTGAGYTPGGQVDFILATNLEPRAGYTSYADAAGALTGFTGVDSADLLLTKDQDREAIFVSANDWMRIQANQQPPESQLGVSAFTFTRWEGYSPRRFVPGERVTVRNLRVGVRGRRGRLVPLPEGLANRGVGEGGPARRRVRGPHGEGQSPARYQARRLPGRSHDRPQAARPLHMDQGARDRSAPAASA